MSGPTKQSAESRKRKRHPEYYLEDGTLVFLVEDILFRVHRHFIIRDSVVFRDMLSMPPPSHQVEGLADEKPIMLDGVRSVDFARLLWMFYNPKFDDYSASAETWSSILKLADMWQFETIRKTAINHLGRMSVDPVFKIALSYKHNIPREWARTAFMALCKRNDPLSSDEMASIGFEHSAMVSRAREGYLRLQAAEQQPSLKRVSGDMADDSTFALSIVKDIVSPPLSIWGGLDKVKAIQNSKYV